KACTGWLEIRLPPGAAGQRVIMEFGDAFERGRKSVPFRAARPGDRLNAFNQRSEYVYRGHGEEVFRNRFNYASFRYIRIVNVPGQLDSSSIKTHLITTDLPMVGAFTSSNRTLNRIHDTMRHTLRCLMLGGYQVDCHSRERLGYGGDGQSSLETTLTMLRSDAFYRKWTADWLDAQRPDGGLPHTAPCPAWAGGGPFWCGFLTAATWRHYLHYGDLTLLRRNYPALVRWLRYVARSTRAGLLRPWPIVNYRNWYLGDWATPDGIDQKHPESIDLFCNCYIIHALGQVANMAEALGRSADAARWRREAARRRPAVHRAFYHPSKGVYADGDQIDLVMPLMVGVVPETLHAIVFRKFEHELMVKHKGHLATGLSGTYMMIQYLQSIGRNDLIYAFASKTTAPSWGYMMRHGATAIWEYWTDKRSRIHNCYNNIGSWFYQGLAGIYPDPAGPGFTRVLIRPAFLRELKHVRAAYDSVQGRIECTWRLTGKRAVVEIAIPAGARATVQLPAQSAKDVRESGRPLAAAEGVEITAVNGRWVTLMTASGRYRFSLPRHDSA
ncbi:MAG: family 78 glycoside hydrolase catalytic domain, partial [Kiritimatiellota bacterium]|nr:family 78 glycoside hydrolase catalytic domain [Kiritimatiellota bacterium]